MKETSFAVNSFTNVIRTERDLKMSTPNFHRCSYMHSRHDEVVLYLCVMIKVCIVDGVVQHLQR